MVVPTRLHQKVKTQKAKLQPLAHRIWGRHTCTIGCSWRPENRRERLADDDRARMVDDSWGWAKGGHGTGPSLTKDIHTQGQCTLQTFWRPDSSSLTGNGQEWPGTTKRGVSNPKGKSQSITSFKSPECIPKSTLARSGGLKIPTVQMIMDHDLPQLWQAR